MHKSHVLQQLSESEVDWSAALRGAEFDFRRGILRWICF